MVTLKSFIGTTFFIQFFISSLSNAQTLEVKSDGEAMPAAGIVSYRDLHPEINHDLQWRIKKLKPLALFYHYIFGNMSQVIDTGPISRSSQIIERNPTDLAASFEIRGRRIRVQAVYGAPLLAEIELRIDDIQITPKGQYIRIVNRLKTKDSSELQSLGDLALLPLRYFASFFSPESPLDGVVIQEFFTPNDDSASSIFRETFRTAEGRGILSPHHYEGLLGVLSSVYLLGQGTADARGLENFAKALEYQNQIEESATSVFENHMVRAANQLNGEAAMNGRPYPTKEELLRAGFHRQIFGITLDHESKIWDEPEKINTLQVGDKRFNPDGWTEFARLLPRSTEHHIVHVHKSTYLYNVKMSDISSAWSKLTISGRGTGIAERGIQVISQGRESDKLVATGLRPDGFPESLGDSVEVWRPREKNQNTDRMIWITSRDVGPIVSGTSSNIFIPCKDHNNKDVICYYEEGYYAVPPTSNFVPREARGLYELFSEFSMATIELFAPSFLSSAPMMATLGYVARTHMASYNLDAAILQIINQVNSQGQ